MKYKEYSFFLVFKCYNFSFRFLQDYRREIFKIACDIKKAFLSILLCKESLQDTRSSSAHGRSCLTIFYLVHVPSATPPRGPTSGG